MASIRKRGRVWYFRFVDADGVQHERKGCPDRRETEAMAAGAEAEAGKVRAGLIDPKAIGYRTHEARTLSDQLSDFKAALVAKGGTAKHANVSTNRAGKVLALAQIKRISDLSLQGARSPGRPAIGRTRARDDQPPCPRRESVLSMAVA